MFYPELAIIVGTYIPNYQGAFLRGYGSRISTHYGIVTHSSGNLGEWQGDATRILRGRAHIHHGFSTLASGIIYGTGNIIQTRKLMDGTGSIWNGYSGDLEFDSSRIVPVANENRPINMAVKYLIRAAN